MRASKGCPEEGELLAYAEGLLDEGERLLIERHLEVCARCRKLAGEIGSVAQALRRATAARSGGAAGRDQSEREATGEGCPGEELLAAYADGSLAGRRAARIEEHLACCPTCLAQVADLVAIARGPGREPPDRAVEAVLARLDVDRRTAVVRLAERSVVLIRDFIRAGLPAGPGAPFGLQEPAYATARGGHAPAVLRWSEAGGLDVECEVRRAAGGAALTGRVTVGGAPARATSVRLTTRDRVWGPESVDSRGRFGPWPLPEGTSRLALGGGDSGEAVELAIEVEVAPEEAAAE